MIRHLDIDDATVRALERHELHAHAIPHREVIELGDSVVLHDPRDRDPFWNRMASVRWPEGAAGFDRRLASALSLFAAIDRTPHVWPSPAWSRPADLVTRLLAHGFRDHGSGQLLVLDEPVRCPPVAASELGPSLSLHAIRRLADTDGVVLGELGMVLAESFDAAPGRATDLAADLAAALDDGRVTLVLARVDGEPAAVAKATAFGGLTYLASIGTRPAFRGRGLAALATRHVLASVGDGAGGTAYLGVYSGNEAALRAYSRLGFASVGESPDLVLG